MIERDTVSKRVIVLINGCQTDRNITVRKTTAPQPSIILQEGGMYVRHGYADCFAIDLSTSYFAQLYAVIQKIANRHLNFN